MRRCPCGQPVHYSDPMTEAAVDALVARLGVDVEVTTPEGTWLVPRDYIALHGIKAAELPALAERLGFKKVEP